jgi:hypothetical protein
MGRIALGVAVALALGWFMFGRGGNAAAMTDCLTDAGATVEESERFGQLFPYAIAARTLDRVEEYPELEGAKFYSVRYGSDRAILFIGMGDEASAAFESTLAGLVGREGQTMSSRRSGKALLVWERATYAPDLDACFA